MKVNWQHCKQTGKVWKWIDNMANRLEMYESVSTKSAYMNGSTRREYKVYGKYWKTKIKIHIYMKGGATINGQKWQ